MTDDGRIVWRPLAALWMVLLGMNAGHEMTQSAVLIQSAASPLLLLVLQAGMGLLTLGLSVWALYTLWHRPGLPFLEISVLAYACTFSQLATQQFGKLTAGTPVSPLDWAFAVLTVLVVILMAALVIHSKGVRTLIRSALFGA